jgi:hypothetical protein
MPERIRALAEDITLADLLDSPATACDAISLISNIINSGWMYADIKTANDISIERVLFTISQAYGVEARHYAFGHLRDRRQFAKQRQ